MSQSNPDVYEQVADMIIEEDFMAGPKTPAFVRVISLQFSQAEARLALQIRTTGATLDELAKKTRIRKDALKNVLMSMADKGTVFYDSSDDPTYKVVKMAAPGLTETGLWAGIKFPYSVRLANAINELMKEWAEHKLGKLGFAFAPVWAAPNTLPKDAKPEENLLEVIKDEGHYSVSPCPCRLSQWIADPGNHCDHLLEACVHTGDQSRWTVKHGMARELTFDELAAHLEKMNKDGLVHTLNIQNSICNCCNDCCAISLSERFGPKAFLPSPFIPRVDEQTCNACDKCAEQCPTTAIAVEQFGDSVSVDIEYDKCIGCGVCITSCQKKCMWLERRPVAA